MSIKISVPDPSNPHNIPIYEGEDVHAIHQLIGGVYDATGVVDGIADIPGQLVVHDNWSRFEIDQCGMLGCSEPAPHNHTELALL